MTKKQKDLLAAEEVALAEAKSKEERRLAGLEKYRKRNLQQKNYREAISAKAKVQIQKQKEEPEKSDEDDAGIQSLAAIRVQSAIRKRQSHVRVKNIRQERSRAAQGLQRVARGRRDRRRVSLLQDEKEAERVQRVQMAKELQRVARGRASRKRVMRLRKLSVVEKEAAEEAVRREMKRQEDEEKKQLMKEAAAEAERKAEEELAARAKEEEAEIARVKEEEAVIARAKEEEAEIARAKEEEVEIARAKEEEAEIARAKEEEAEIARPKEEADAPAQKVASAHQAMETAQANEEEEEDDDYGNDFSFESASSPMKTPQRTAADTPDDPQTAEPMDPSTSTVDDEANVAGTTTPFAEPIFSIGERIEAQVEGWAKAYAGEIIEEPMVRSDGSVSYSIRFDDGEVRASVDASLVRSIASVGGEAAQPYSEQAGAGVSSSSDAATSDVTAPAESDDVTTPGITATDNEEEGQEVAADAATAAVASASAVRRFDRGDRIEAQCSGWAKAYAGEIIDAPLVRSDGTVAYSIRFDDGEERQNVDGNLVS